MQYSEIWLALALRCRSQWRVATAVSVVVLLTSIFTNTHTAYRLQERYPGVKCDPHQQFPDELVELGNAAGFKVFTALHFAHSSCGIVVCLETLGGCHLYDVDSFSGGYLVKYRVNDTRVCDGVFYMQLYQEVKIDEHYFYGRTAQNIHYAYLLTQNEIACG